MDETHTRLVQRQPTRDEDDPLPDGRIGPWAIVRELGRGGMGVVYLAKRADADFEQQVAIKVVKRGMDTDFILERFRHERQILASLDHPNIARLLDGGSTADGRPFFVMEYVEGVPITEYCERHQLPTARRLAIFQNVCGAIQYAHQNLIIHRDLKPANILVTAEGVPKLLDFGIAKLLHPSPGETIEVTQTGMRLMTPEYASPEQVRGQPVTTASDVYALGVLLYEILTGQRPYRLVTGTHEELARIICEEDPPKPSTAVTDGATVLVRDSPDAETRDAAAAERLRRRLAGDLDTIVLKAMSKDPLRRYASAAQLSEDIERHLAGLPVIARPDTFTYRLGKFVRRHRRAVAAALVVLATLVAGVVSTVWQAQIARAERARAERRFEDVRALAHAFMFEVHDAIALLPGSTRARELLVSRARQYLDSLAAEAAGDPSLQRELASAYQKLGEVQGRPLVANLGDTRGALASQQKALALREEIARARPKDAGVRRELAISHVRVAEMLARTGDTAGALASYERARTAFAPMASAAPADLELQRELAASLNGIGDMLSSTGNIRAALERYGESLATLERAAERAPDDRVVQRFLAVAHQRMGNHLGNPQFTNVGDLAGARRHLERTIAILEPLVAAEPHNGLYRRTLAVACGNLADVFMASGDVRRARAGNERALSLFRTMLELDATNAQARRDVAMSFLKLAHMDAAERRYVRALANAERALPMFEELATWNPQDLLAQQDLATILVERGDLQLRTGARAGAIEGYRRAVAIMERVVAQGDPGNYEFTWALAAAAAQLAQGLATPGAAGPPSPAELDEAARWSERSLALFDDLRERGVLSANDVGMVDKLRQELDRLLRGAGARRVS